MWLTTLSCKRWLMASNFAALYCIRYDGKCHHCSLHTLWVGRIRTHGRPTDRPGSCSCSCMFNSSIPIHVYYNNSIALSNCRYSAGYNITLKIISSNTRVRGWTSETYRIIVPNN